MRTDLSSRSRRGRLLLAIGGVVLAAAVAGPPPPALAAPSNGVVVNEVYGGGGNAGATLTNDFVELANRGATAVDVSGWSVQYHPAAGGGAWQRTNLTGAIPAGATYLVQEAAGTGGTQALPTPDATGAILMAAGAGTVAVASSQTTLTCQTSADCQAAAVDLVGYGTAAINEAAPAPAPSATVSDQRGAQADSDDNSADFTTAAPTPAAGGTENPTPPAEPGPLRIHDIQGAGWLTPHQNEAVTNVPGIVTAIRTAGSSRGYWIQDPAPDADPATSEGIFVFTSSPGVAVGDAVLVSGTARDFYPLASGESVATTSNLSVTEIGGPTVTVVSHDNALPAPEAIGPGTVPGVYAPDLGGRDIEGTPVTPGRSALDFWESREGMRVEVDDARVVGPSNDFGEQYVTTKPAQAATFRGGTEILGENQIPSGRLEVVPADGSDPGVSVGDVFAGATIGPVDWSQFGGYTLAASKVGDVHHNALPRVVAAAQGARQLAVATYNVENLAPSDPASKFAALADGIVTNLAKPDIVAVEEVQDNTGDTDDGVVAADRTLTQLTAAIVAAGGPRYDWREVDPVDDQDGGEPGGNIRVVFLFDPSRVSFVDRGGAGVDRSRTGTAIVKRNGEPSLTLSPGRIDPTNPVWSTSRKPLAGEFEFRGKRVIVIANHFDSKGGDQNADGRFQFPFQSSAVQRAGQATVEHDFVAGALGVDRKANVVVLGDLNDFQFSPALSLLRTGTADGTAPSILSDLITTLPVSRQYTYVFNGVSQVLDHILVSSGVRGVEYEVVHINAEYADQVSDHDPQVVRLQP